MLHELFNGLIDKVGSLITHNCQRTCKSSQNTIVQGFDDGRCRVHLKDFGFDSLSCIIHCNQDVVIASVMRCMLNWRDQV